MQMKGLKKLVKYADALGLKTLGDLQDFYNTHARQGEAVISVLERELFEN